MKKHNQNIIKFICTCILVIVCLIIMVCLTGCDESSIVYGSAVDQQNTIQAANKAAITYNEYFLKNSYVFEDNILEDIRENLELLE